MNERLLTLATRHGALKARIAAQREALAQQVKPFEAALGVVDQGMLGIDWMKRHPAAVGGVVALLAVWRPRRAWAWAKRGFLMWRGWRGMRAALERLG